MNEEIQVGLGLNTSAFQEGLKKSSRDVASFADKIKAPFAAISGFGGALAGIGIVSQIQNISEYAEKIRNLGEALNANTTDLQKWFNAISYSGVGSETATKALTKFTMKLSAASDGASKEAEAFANLGVSIKDAEGKIRPTMEILGDVSDIFATMPDKSERSRVAVELFGKQGLKMVSALSMGREEMERLGSIRQVISPEALETLDKMGDDIKEVFDSMKGHSASTIAAMSPLVTFFHDAAFGVATFGQKMADAFSTITVGLIDNATTTGEKIRLAFFGPIAGGDWKGIGKALAEVFNPQIPTVAKLREKEAERLALIEKLVKASKQQAEYDKIAFDLAVQRGDLGVKVDLMRAKELTAAKAVAELEAKNLDTPKHKLELIEARTALMKAQFDSEKAFAAFDEDAKKNAIAAYTNEAEQLNRINKLRQDGLDLEKTLAELKSKGTKTTVKELAAEPLLQTDTAEQRQNKLEARTIKDIEDRQEFARKSGRPVEAAELQKQALELRGKLSEKVFQAQEIKPFADIEGKISEKKSEIELQKWYRMQDQILEKEKNRINLGEGWAVTDEEKNRRFDIIGEAEQRRQAVEKLRLAREADIKAQAVKRVTDAGVSPLANPEHVAELLAEQNYKAISAKMAEGINEGINSELAVVNDQLKSTAQFANVMDTRTFANMAESLDSFDSSAMEEKLDQISAAVSGTLKVKAVNGP